MRIISLVIFLIVLNYFQIKANVSAISVRCDTMPYEFFDSGCKFSPDSSFLHGPIIPKIKWVTAKIGTSMDLLVSANNFYLNDSLIIVKCSDTLNGSNLNSICKLNHTNNLVTFKTVIDTALYSSNPHMMIFSFLDKKYIVTITNNGEIMCFENNVIIWKNSSFAYNYPILQNFKTADFNQDGTPEIYFADKIISLESGRLLFDGGQSKGCNYFSTFDTSLCNVTHSYAAELTNSPGLELACGNIVYEISLNNLNDTIGNTSNALYAPSPVRDGYTAVADFDLDGLLDVVVVRSNLNYDGGLWVWNPRSKTIIADIESHSFKGLRGSIPTIHDLNNDCYPEIIVSYENMLRVYSFDGSTSLKLLYALPTSDKSGFTGSTVFDLNADGLYELLYRDETEFKIFDALTGSVIYQTPIFSATGNEYPIVSDIDNDGQAEILVSGGLESKRESRIFCFESAASPWAPARKIWNQTGYNITNVNDDGTIPQYQQNNAAFFPMDSCGGCNQPYNTFMAQATYRDQNGCAVWPAMDMTTNILEQRCEGDSVHITVEIRNQSGNHFRHDSVNLGLFVNDIDTPTLFQSVFWPKEKVADTLNFSISNIGLTKIRTRVNIPDMASSFAADIHGLTAVLECDYENNADSINFTPCAVEEDCTNGIDDDGDGLVDGFDPDCLEVDSLPKYDLDCQFIPEIDLSNPIQPKLKWVTDKLGNSLETKVSAVKLYLIDEYLITNCFDTIDGMVQNSLCKFELSNQNQSSKVVIDTSTYSSLPELLFFVYNNNEYIITITYSGKIICLENDIIKWSNADFEYNYAVLQNFKAADFNEDNVPEIYFADNIISLESGKTLIQGKQSKGCNIFSIFNECSATHSYAADFTNSPGLELGCGNVVYEIILSNMNDTLGNSINEILAPISVNDGFTGIADFDLDGYLDLIVIRGNTKLDGGLWVWDPRKRTVIADIEGLNFIGDLGSVPTIIDVTGDCYPEIFVTYKNLLNVFTYDGSPNLKLLYSLSTSDNSGFTISTIFDLNNDGQFELLYRDEFYFKIFDAETGILIFDTPILSSTVNEYPIITDIDDDGQAEILVSGGLESKRESRIFCFESASSPWAPARKIWNQTGYNITNINDDGTIPQYQQNNAAFFPMDSCGGCNQPYNTFMCQATYRDQNGCAVWPAMDMTTNILEHICEGDSMHITVEIRNQSGNHFRHDSVNIGLYVNDTDTPALFQSIFWPKEKVADTLTFSISNIGLTKIRTRVNIPSMISSFADDIHGLTSVLECDYTNNNDSIFFNYNLACKGPDDLIYSEECELSISVDSILETTNNLYCEPSFYILLIQKVEGNTLIPIDTNVLTMSGTYRVGVKDPISSNSCWTILTLELSPTPSLDLGPDITKCGTEVFTLYAGPNFESYLWSDLTTDSIYSGAAAGLHHVEAIDQCGRVHRDTVVVSHDTAFDVDLGTVPSVCKGETVSFDIGSSFEQVNWYPSEMVDCDTCTIVNIVADTSILIYVTATKADCISTDSVTIQVRLPIELTDTVSICEGDSYTIWDSTFTQSADYSITSANCDSTLMLSITVIPSVPVSDTMMLCSGDSVIIANTLITQEGLYPFTFPTNAGCDSLVELYVGSVPPANYGATWSICPDDSVLIHGVWQSQKGSYTGRYTSAQGCDSTATISLLHYQSYDYRDSLTICEGDSIRYAGTWLKDDGDYTFPFQSAAGCDSVYSLHLTTSDRYESKIPFAICEGDSIQIHGIWQNASGTFTDTYQSLSGCDSLVEVVLTVSPLDVEPISYDACEGDTIIVGTTMFTTSGTMLDTISASPCDIIQDITVNFREKEESLMTFTLCPADSIQVGNQWLTAAGEYAFTYTNQWGCDSVFVANIEQVNIPSAPVVDIDCDALEVLAQLGAESGWQITWDNGDTGEFTTYNQGATGEVSLVHDAGCTYYYQFDIPVIPRLQSLHTLRDTTVNAGTKLTYQLPLYDLEWDMQWTTSLDISCDTCNQVTIAVGNQSGSVTVILDHISGCSYQYTFFISVEAEAITIPNVFSPNEDGSNDIWEVDLTRVANPNTIIYDRWGSQVFASSSSVPRWDGTLNGKAVLRGVYVYVITFEEGGQRKAMRGDLTVIR